MPGTVGLLGGCPAGRLSPEVSGGLPASTRRFDPPRLPIFARAPTGRPFRGHTPRPAPHSIDAMRRSSCMPPQRKPCSYAWTADRSTAPQRENVPRGYTVCQENGGPRMGPRPCVPGGPTAAAAHECPGSAQRPAARCWAPDPAGPAALPAPGTTPGRSASSTRSSGTPTLKRGPGGTRYLDVPVLPGAATRPAPDQGDLSETGDRRAVRRDTLPPAGSPARQGANPALRQRVALEATGSLRTAFRSPPFFSPRLASSRHRSEDCNAAARRRATRSAILAVRRVQLSLRQGPMLEMLVNNFRCRGVSTARYGVATCLPRPRDRPYRPRHGRQQARYPAAVSPR